MTSKNTTVLVVEDDTLIRMTVVEELEDNGFAVHEAETADDAVAILASNPDIDVVFTDVDMPGSMNGVELALHVRVRYPDISVIVASGYLKVPRSFLPDDVPFFAKPYRMAPVLAHIRSFRNIGPA